MTGSISTASTRLAPCCSADATSVPDPGAEDEHVIETLAEDLVRPLVEVFLLPNRRHRLVEDVVHLHHGFLALRVRGDLVVRRPQRVARELVRDAERHGQQHQAACRPRRVAARAGTARRGEAEPEPGHRRQLQRRERAEADHAGKAAREVDEIGAQRRVRIHLAPEPLRQRHEQQRDGDAEQRQEPRALDRDHDVGRATREVDALGGLRHGDVDAPRATAITSSTCTSGNQRSRLARIGASRQPMPMPRKLASRMKFEKVRQQADVGWHPPDQRDLEEQDEEGNQEEGPAAPRLVSTIRACARTSAARRWSRRDSMMNFGVSTPSLPQVIFSFGTAPEYEP